MRKNTSFDSYLKAMMESYMIHREAKGANVKKEYHYLLSFDLHLKNIAFTGKEITAKVVDEWLASLPASLNANTINVYISHYKQFARYLQSFGYIVSIPERTIADKSYAPYIFNNDELRALIEAADNKAASSSKTEIHNAVCFSVMLRMLIACGFRLNEIRLLQTKDVNLESGVIFIRNAKEHRDRLVPMHESMTKVTALFAKSMIPQVSGWFFPELNGNPIPYSQVRERFNSCLVTIGILKPELPLHHRKICLHCLRHSFAVSAYQKLEMEGVDLYSEIPILSTYMGHANLYGTESYLHMTPDSRKDILNRMEEFNRGLFPEVIE